MRHFAVAVLVLAAGASCSEAQDAGDISAYYGLWQLSPATAKTMPLACRTASYQITPDTITTNSGELVIVTSYEPIRTSDGLVLRQSNISHNGKPNCQGIPADFVVEHFVMNLELDIVGGDLRIYLVSRTGRNHFDFIRSTNDVINAQHERTP
jgi:hypothetical protein